MNAPMEEEKKQERAARTVVCESFFGRCSQSIVLRKARATVTIRGFICYSAGQVPEVFGGCLVG
jgi:hypothetical protein